MKMQTGSMAIVLGERFTPITEPTCNHAINEDLFHCIH